MIDPKVKAKTQTRTCKGCGEIKLLDDYYRSSNGRDGYFGKCKSCVKVASQEWRRDNRQRHAETTAKWQRENRNKAREIEQRTKAKFPEKAAARRALNEAVRWRVLGKPTSCEDCGQEFAPVQIHGHHPDYSKPLEVEWLCKGCHDVAHERGLAHAN